MLDQAAEVMLSYKKLCVLSFGPNALKNLFVTATGQVELTNNGAVILKCLNQQHPVARLITDTLMGFHSKHGDGTKTLLFLATETVAQINQTLPKNETAQQMEKLRYVRTLRHLQYSLLDEVMKNIQPDEHELNFGKLRDSTLSLLRNLIMTKLSGSLSIHSCSHFAYLLIDLVKTNCSNEHDIADYFQSLCDHSELIFMEEVGGMLWQSYVTDGVILQRQFHDLACPVDPLKDIHFVLIGLCFDIDDSDQNAIIQVTEKTCLKDLFFWKSQLYSLLVKHWKTLDVNLVISSSRIPDQLALLLQKSNIYVVHFCPEEEMERLSTLSNCVIENDVQEILNSHYTGRAESCVLKSVSGKNCVHISGIRNCCDITSITDECAIPRNHQPPKYFNQSKHITGHIVVCGSSPGVCQQTKMLLSNTCKLLAETVHKESVTSLTDNNASDSSYKKIISIKGGGAFELAMFHLLSQLIGSNIDDMNSSVLKILAQSYISVALVLVKNSHRPCASKSSIKDVLSLSTKPKDFPFVPQGIDARQGNRLLHHGNILEPLCLKIGQWHHLIMLVTQLLRLDTVISIRRSLKKSEKINSEDEDNEDSD